MKLLSKNIGILILIYFYFQLQLIGQTKHTVVYGNHATITKTFERNTLRIFMDMNGDFYPENIISNEELEKHGKSQLIIWSKNNPDKFSQIASSYHLTSSSFSEENYFILQDSIQKTILTTLNNPTFTIQTWVFHGFRKQIAGSEIDNLTSIYENEVFRNRINNYTKNDTTNLIVEVYWDGKYELRGGVLRTIKLGILFKKEAIPNAINCGHSLRKVFNEIKCKHINIVSHSTGTFITSNLLFNTTKYNSYPTPSQADIRIVLTASASPGIKHFKNYYNRNSTFEFKTQDNYKLFNLINENDEVLLKKKGNIQLPKTLGNTTLGCNFKGESDQLKVYFKENFCSSIYKEGYVENTSSHWFKSYISSTGFNEVLLFLFDE